MDRNEIIQQLGMYAYTAAMTGQHSQTIPADLLNETIRALKAAPEWISTEDRLPPGDGHIYGEGFEESDLVIVYGTNPDGNPVMGTAQYFYDHTDKTGSGWGGEIKEWDVGQCDITHWRPLPKQPGEE